MNKESMGPGPMMGFEMMSQMMEKCGCGQNMEMMQGKMMEMMPQRLEMMLPKFPKEKRSEFIENMMTILVKVGSSDMSAEEKAEFIDSLKEKMDALKEEE